MGSVLYCSNTGIMLSFSVCVVFVVRAGRQADPSTRSPQKCLKHLITPVIQSELDVRTEEAKAKQNMEMSVERHCAYIQPSAG